MDGFSFQGNSLKLKQFTVILLSSACLRYAKSEFPWIANWRFLFIFPPTDKCGKDMCKANYLCLFPPGTSWSVSFWSCCSSILMFHPASTPSTTSTCVRSPRLTISASPWSLLAETRPRNWRWGVDTYSDHLLVIYSSGYLSEIVIHNLVCIPVACGFHKRSINSEYFAC